MKKILRIHGLLLTGAILIFMYAPHIKGQTRVSDTLVLEQIHYSCPEHPSVMLNQTGTCPICGLLLVDTRHPMDSKMYRDYDTSKTQNQKDFMMNDSVPMRKHSMMNDSATKANNQGSKKH